MGVRELDIKGVLVKDNVPHQRVFKNTAETCFAGIRFFGKIGNEGGNADEQDCLYCGIDEPAETGYHVERGKDLVYNRTDKCEVESFPWIKICRIEEREIEYLDENGLTQPGEREPSDTYTTNGEGIQLLRRL